MKPKYSSGVYGGRLQQPAQILNEWLLAKELEITPYCLDPTIEVGEVEFFVRRVEIVIGQAKAHHHAGNLQVPLKDSDNWNGSSGAHVNRLLLEHLLQSFSGGSDPTAFGADDRRGS